MKRSSCDCNTISILQVTFNGSQKTGSKIASDNDAISLITSPPVSNVYKLQCFPLYSILLAVGQTTIDLFSLDVEGFELDVLQTIPWDKVDIKVQIKFFSTILFNLNLIHVSFIYKFSRFWQLNGIRKSTRRCQITWKASDTELWKKFNILTATTWYLKKQIESNKNLIGHSFQWKFEKIN